MRHWFDDGETVVRGPPGGAGAATHASRRVAAPTSSRGASALNSDRLATWRGGTSDAFVVANPMDTGCEDDEGGPRLFAGRAHGSDGRPHTRSSSRNNRRQSRTSRVAAGAGARGGGGGGGVGGSGRRGGAIDHARSASPVLAARGSTGGVASGAPSSLVGSHLPAGLNARSETTAVAVEDSRSNTSGVTEAARESLTPRGGDAVDERGSEGGVSYVQGFAARMRHVRQQQAGDREQQQGGRRSLSDFLREIEEIVRIQRTEVGAAYVGLEFGRTMLLCGP